MNRVRKRKASKAELQSVFEDPRNVLLIHYSCESFYDRTDGSSPRVTSIAARNLKSGQTHSFSIHQLAERRGKNWRNEVEVNYDLLERKMLAEFYGFVRQNSNRTWLHWNMRDINYGFAALAHRFKVLGGTDFVELPESQLVDLSRLLVGLFGVNYIGHPRLPKIVEKNRISNKDFLTGEQEAKAFEDKDYVKLHLSTLRKVDILANLAERTLDNSLKTEAKWWEVYGTRFESLVLYLQEHWLVPTLVVVVGILGSLASIFGTTVWDFFEKRP